MTADASPLAGANVRTLTQRLCEVEAVLDVVGRLGAQLRAELHARAVDRWREDGTAPTFRAPGLGSVSLSVPQQKVVVADPAEFASWVAQKHPDAATARIVIACPPDRLEFLLEGLDALRAVDGVKITADVEVSPAFTRRLLDSEVAVADAGDDNKAAIDTTTGEVIDGVRVELGADPGNPDGPQPKSISVRLEPQAKADAAAQAAARLATVLERGLSDALAADVAELPALPAATLADMPAMTDVHDLAAEGEPDEEPIDLDRCDVDGCAHPRARHNGKTHAGRCLEPGCDCRRFRIPSMVRVAW